MNYSVFLVSKTVQFKEVQKSCYLYITQSKIHGDILTM